MPEKNTRVIEQKLTPNKRSGLFDVEKDDNKIDEILQETSKQVNSTQEELKPLKEGDLIKNIVKAIEEKFKVELTQEDHDSLAFFYNMELNEKLDEKIKDTIKNFLINNKDLPTDNETINQIQKKVKAMETNPLIKNIEEAIEEKFKVELTQKDHDKIINYYNFFTDNLNKNIPIGTIIKKVIEKFLKNNKPSIDDKNINKIWGKVMNMPSTQDYLKKEGYLESEEEQEAKVIDIIIYEVSKIISDLYEKDTKKKLNPEAIEEYIDNRFYYYSDLASENNTKDDVKTNIENAVISYINNLEKKSKIKIDTREFTKKVMENYIEIKNKLNMDIFEPTFKVESPGLDESTLDHSPSSNPQEEKTKRFKKSPSLLKETDGIDKSNPNK